MFQIPAFDFAGAPWLVLVFGVLLWIQARRPLRRQQLRTMGRLMRNIGLSMPALLTLRLLLLPIPLLVASWADRHGVGLLNWLIPQTGYWPWMGGLLGVAAFDYAYYWWHYATHKVPLLWRFHNVHHTDLDMDVSTAIRFHFGELLLSVPFRAAVVLLFGVSFWAALAYEVVFETAGQFHHSNWRLPARLERWLNAVVVTPRMHGIHHSIVRDEFDSNWGTLFSWWDRLHGTHRLDIPQHELTLGVPAYRDERELTVGALLKMPFGPQREWRLPSGERPETRRKSPER
ncbi:sterol desaturase family protein [Tellurirhabdus rosea]|uniref:sterol desaturase family protein n=1 Tax=Tellurirhabdus rosea TaxID=2674997 RepID=UPI002254CBAE|nr:sterol desaturase family protein [Tellurirhabdus rosea]